MMTHPASDSPALKLWSKLGHSAAGRWLFSRIICFKAPYFATIRPAFTLVSPGHVELVFKKRRAVHNHLKTVHAIAMCNAAELAGGICMDVSLRRDYRWIPVGMQVRYLRLAKTDLKAVCKIEEFQWAEPRDVNMPVKLFDTGGSEVFCADISMRISPKRK